MKEREEVVTRNSKKLNREPHPDHDPAAENPAAAAEPPPPANNNPFGLSFVVPTEVVELPSAGAFYSLDNPLSGIDRVEIKHMTAREEDLLSSVKDKDNENLFNDLINGLLTNKAFKADLMLEEDKMAILLKARATGYGDIYTAKAWCDNCQDSTDHAFDLTKVSVTPPEQEAHFDPESDCYDIELPVSKIKAKVRILSKEDRETVDRERDKKNKLKIDFNTTVSLLSRSLVAANDCYEKTMLRKLIEVLPAADAKTILNFHKDIFPRLSTLQSVPCSVCGTATEKEVPLTWAFFRTDI